MMTKREAMEYLRVSQATVDRLMKSRDLAFVKIGKKVIFRRRDLDAYIRKNTVKAKASK